LKVYAEVYGCAASMADGEIALGLLKQAGGEIVASPEDADVNIIVTCAVKGPTADRMVSRVRKLNSLGKPLIVAGCMASGEPRRIKQTAPRAFLLPPKEITRITEAVEKLLGDGLNTPVELEREVKLGLPRVRRNPVISIIPVSEGCRWSKCSFCIVPKTRPGFGSFPIRLILDEVRRSVADGCREIWLTSQDMGSYGMESGRNLLPELLESVNNVEGNFKVRVGMMNPIYLKPILPRLIQAYKGEKIFKFLHLPVQSGSERVLKSMNRGHGSGLYVEAVECFRKELPELTLMTDIIVGYPTETERDFEETLEIIWRTKPDFVNVSRFFPRPGTPAENMKPQPPETVSRRIHRLNEVCEAAALERNERWIGWTGEALVDEWGIKGNWICRNYAYKPIAIKTDKNLMGKIIEVEVTDAKTFHLEGKLKKILH